MVGMNGNLRERGVGRRVPEPRMRRCIVLMTVALVVLSACGGDRETTPETTTPDCPTFMLGEVLTAPEAHVLVSSERVCPGYVTVNPGTPVTFENRDDEPLTVSITEGWEESSDEVTSLEVGPGATAEFVSEEPAVRYFRLSMVPTFLGTIEYVGGKDSGGSSHGHTTSTP